MTQRSDVMRALADLLDQHPEVETPYLDSYGDDIRLIRFQFTSLGGRAADATATTIKAFPGAFEKTYSDEDFYMRGSFAGVRVEIRALREDVCVAREVGTRTVKQRDPEALKLVPEIEVQVPVYEYDCKPLLGKAVA
jgi:hypothetical protein